jgi:hypothetical protein
MMVTTHIQKNFDLKLILSNLIDRLFFRTFFLCSLLIEQTFIYCSTKVVNISMIQLIDWENVVFLIKNKIYGVIGSTPKYIIDLDSMSFLQIQPGNQLLKINYFDCGLSDLASFFTAHELIVKSLGMCDFFQGFSGLMTYNNIKYSDKVSTNYIVEKLNLKFKAESYNACIFNFLTINYHDNIGFVDLKTPSNSISQGIQEISSLDLDDLDKIELMEYLFGVNSNLDEKLVKHIPSCLRCYPDKGVEEFTLHFNNDLTVNKLTDNNENNCRKDELTDKNWSICNKDIIKFNNYYHHPYAIFTTTCTRKMTIDSLYVLSRFLNKSKLQNLKWKGHTKNFLLECSECIIDPVLKNDYKLYVENKVSAKGMVFEIRKKIQKVLEEKIKKYILKLNSKIVKSYQSMSLNIDFLTYKSFIREDVEIIPKVAAVTEKFIELEKKRKIKEFEEIFQKDCLTYKSKLPTENIPQIPFPMLDIPEMTYKSVMVGETAVLDQKIINKIINITPIITANTVLEKKEKEENIINYQSMVKNKEEEVKNKEEETIIVKLVKEDVSLLGDKLKQIPRNKKSIKSVPPVKRQKNVEKTWTVDYSKDTFISNEDFDMVKDVFDQPGWKIIKDYKKVLYNEKNFMYEDCLYTFNDVSINTLLNDKCPKYKLKSYAIHRGEVFKSNNLNIINYAFATYFNSGPLMFKVKGKAQKLNLRTAEVIKVNDETTISNLISAFYLVNHPELQLKDETIGFFENKEEYTIFSERCQLTVSEKTINEFLIVGDLLKYTFCYFNEMDSFSSPKDNYRWLYVCCKFGMPLYELITKCLIKVGKRVIPIYKLIYLISNRVKIK